MRNKSVESRSVISYRSKPTCHARLIQSSQIPKDFFSGHESVKKIRYGGFPAERGEKQIFREFQCMFKMRRNLKSLALKLSPKTEPIEENQILSSDKQNIEIKFPSLHIKRKFSQEQPLKVNQK